MTFQEGRGEIEGEIIQLLGETRRTKMRELWNSRGVSNRHPVVQSIADFVKFPYIFATSHCHS
jgi:hypothetical protein